MTVRYAVSVDVEGRGPIFYARCHPEQLAETCRVAAHALLSEMPWITERHANFHFTVERG